MACLKTVVHYEFGTLSFKLKISTKSFMMKRTNDLCAWFLLTMKYLLFFLSRIIMDHVFHPNQLHLAEQNAYILTVVFTQHCPLKWQVLVFDEKRWNFWSSHSFFNENGPTTPSTLRILFSWCENKILLCLLICRYVKREVTFILINFHDHNYTRLQSTKS